MNTINNSRWCSGKSRAVVRAGEDKAGKPVERKKAEEHLKHRPTPFTACAFFPCGKRKLRESELIIPKYKRNT